MTRAKMGLTSYDLLTLGKVACKSKRSYSQNIEVRAVGASYIGVYATDEYSAYRLLVKKDAVHDALVQDLDEKFEVLVLKPEAYKNLPSAKYAKTDWRVGALDWKFPVYSCWCKRWDGIIEAGSRGTDCYDTARFKVLMNTVKALGFPTVYVSTETDHIKLYGETEGREITAVLMGMRR